MAKPVALVGDPSSHGGVLISSNQDGTTKYGGVDICVAGCLHSCPLFYDPPFNTSPHSTTPVTAVTVRSMVNGKLIVTQGATAGCGAVILPPVRKMMVE